MKRILLITESLCSGGAERQLCGLAIQLKNVGYTVKVVTYVKRQFYESYLREHSINYEFRGELWNKKYRVFKLVKLYKEFHPDVIISFLPSVNISVCLSRLFYKCKLIVSERSFTSKWNIKTILQFSLYQIANYVVANSYSEAENIKLHMPILKPKVRTVTNFVDCKIFTPSKFRENNTVFKILCVGRVLPVKNISSFLEAIYIVKNRGYDFRVIWVGKIMDQEYAEVIKTKIKDLKLTDVFEFKNQTIDIISEYNTATAFCLPSFLEGFPNVICEAMSCGLPILCSDICDNRRIVNDGVNGFLFNPLSIEDMSNKMIKLLDSSSEFLFSMRKSSRQLAIGRFGADLFVQKYMNLIE